jgi:hypothetical protein
VDAEGHSEAQDVERDEVEVVRAGREQRPPGVEQLDMPAVGDTRAPTSASGASSSMSA